MGSCCAKHITTPLTDELVCSLAVGDEVLLSGVIYTARDAAHKRMHEALVRGESLPVELAGQILYYVGPTPPPPGFMIGSAGPTTSGRMDAYTPELLALGLKGMIGKGQRRHEVLDALKQYKAIYLVAIGGLGEIGRASCRERV